MTGRPQALLFDLDGTLIDSAPDLAGAANDMREAHGLERLPLDHLRPMVGAGARGMVARAFGVGPDDEPYAKLREDFLQRYEARMTRHTHVFADMLPVLDALAAHRLPWGIVTNKATRFSEPLVEALGLHKTSATLVSGDTTPHAKPHPAPLLEAARRLNVPAVRCWYIGDDHRDVKAGRAAGMLTVAAAWGYLGEGEPITAWGADHIANAPIELLTLLALA
ncbi:MAG: phosphoglycolate phosphatase [Methylibium sp. NZG]|nr:MAG: phosphoglycolate phosphatase [Methylibium sp. NZG]